MRLEVGAASIDITPELNAPGRDPIYLTGFVRRSGPARGVLHPIAARVMVLQSKGRRIAVISLEVLDLTVEHATALRHRVGRALGISMESVCLCCTHTHYAPAAYPLRQAGAISPAWVAEMEEKVVRCAQDAAARIEPARLVWGAAPLRVGRNRRAHLRADRGGADGCSPCDEAVRVLGALGESGEVRALVLHYACHMVSLPPEDNRVSGDFAGVAAALLERQMGDDSVALFINGCAGDVNPLDEFKGAAERTEAAGRQMADAVTLALAGAQPLPGDGAIDAREAIVSLPVAPPDSQWPDLLKSVTTSLAAPTLDPTGLEARILRAQHGFLERWLPEIEAGRYPRQLPSRVQCIKIGGLTLPALSSEVFYEIGQTIRRAAGDPLVWPTGYANGSHGYICTAAAHREGGYEPVESNWYYDRPPLAASAADSLVAGACALLGVPMPEL